MNYDWTFTDLLFIPSPKEDLEFSIVREAIKKKLEASLIYSLALLPFCFLLVTSNETSMVACYGYPC